MRWKMETLNSSSNSCAFYFLSAAWLQCILFCLSRNLLPNSTVLATICSVPHRLIITKYLQGGENTQNKYFERQWHDADNYGSFSASEKLFLSWFRGMSNDAKHTVLHEHSDKKERKFFNLCRVFFRLCEVSSIRDCRNVLYILASSFTIPESFL